MSGDIGIRPTRLDADAAALWRSEGAWRDDTVHGQLDTMAARQPNQPAIIDGETQLSYGELADLTRVVAAGMRRAGLRSGQAVLVNLPCWWESIVITYAVLRVGGLVVQIIPAAGEHELRHVVSQVDPAIVVTSELPAAPNHLELVRSLSGAARVFSVRGWACGDEQTFESLMTAPPDDESDAADADAAAVVLFTSGTTSSAKGVIHTHNTLRAEARSLAKVHGCGMGDVFLAALQIGHVGGLIYAILLPAECGGCAVLQSAWSAELALRLIERFKVTVFSGVPAFPYALADLPNFRAQATRSMRLFAVGGSRVTAASVVDAIALFGCWSKRGYGSTEVPTATNAALGDDPWVWTETDGRPVEHMRVRIRSAEVEMATGEEGEIELFGPEMFQGYVDEQLNDEAFTADGWYRTGDLGRVDAAGALKVTGRIKDLIIRGGENISAQELEELILELPEVEDVAAVGTPDDRLGERVCAVVVPRAGQITLEAINEHLRRRGVAKFKLPERLELRSELPRTSGGKIRKTDLRRELSG